MAKNEAKIKFTAETGAFNDAIKKANNEMGLLRSELKLNSEQMKDTGETVEALKDRHTLLQSQLDQQRSKVDALSSKLESAKQIFGENSDEVTKLKTQLANARTTETQFQRAVNECAKKIEQQGDSAQDARQETKKFGDSASKAEQATESLSDKLDRQQKELDELKKDYANAVSQFGKSSKGAKSLANQIDSLSSDLKKSKSAFDDASKKADELDNSMEDVDESSGKAGEALAKIGGGACEVAAAGFVAVTAAAGATVGAFLATAEATREYRTDQGKLDAAFEAAGKSAESAENTYSDLFRVIGESDQSVEAAQQIAMLATSEKDAAKWASYASGVVGKFGDALQPETFYESANETLKLGKATGAFAQMLEGSGKDVEKFDKQLSECKTEEEKQALMLSVVEETLGAAGKAYEETNADIMASNEANAAMTESMAAVGAAAEPVKTALTNMGAGILKDLAPAVSLIGEGMTGAINGTEGAAETLAEGVGGALEAVVGTIDEVMGTVVETLPSLVTKLSPVLVNGVVSLIGTIVGLMPELVTAITGMLPDIISGIVGITDAIIGALPGVMSAICGALPTLIPALIDGIVSMIVIVCQNFISIIQPILDALPDIIISIVEALVSNLPALIDGIISLIMGIVEAIPEVIGALVDAIPTVVSLLIQALLENLPAIISGLIKVVLGIAAALPDILFSLIEGFANIFVGIWNGFKTAFTESGIGAWLSEAWDGISKTASEAWDGMCEKASEAWESIKEYFAPAGKWFSENFAKAKEGATKAWASAKSGFSKVWSNIKGAFSNVGGWFKTTFTKGKTNATNAWSNIKSVFTGIKDRIVDAFSDIKEKLSAPFEKARDAIKKVADKIKGFFKGTISMPKIKMPHFSISPSGWKIGDLLKGTIPKLSIKWYAQGGILTHPTIFGMNGNTLMGGGEAGPEAILPIDRLEGYISNAIEKAQNVVNLQSLADAIERLADRPISMNINGREFAMATASDGDSVNGSRSTFRSRGLILD